MFRNSILEKLSSIDKVFFKIPFMFYVELQRSAG